MIINENIRNKERPDTTNTKQTIEHINSEQQQTNTIQHIIISNSCNLKHIRNISNARQQKNTETTHNNKKKKRKHKNKKQDKTTHQQNNKQQKTQRTLKQRT